MPPHKSVAVDYAEISKEPWLVALLETLEKPRYRLDKSVISEIKSISRQSTEKYAANGLPRLPVVRTKNDMVTLQEENARCLADRDRATEILISYTAIKYALDALWEKAESQFLENEMYQKLSNAESRKAFIAGVLKPVHEKRNHVKQVLAMAEILQAHLSHTHFAIQQHAKMGETLLGFRSA